MVEEHYNLDKASSPGFVHDDDGNDIGIVFLLNGRLHFLPRDSDTPTEIPEDILPKSMPMKSIKHGEEDGEAKGERVKIRKIVTDTNGPHVAVEWELPSEKGQILLLNICLEATHDGVNPVFVEVFNTGRDQASNQFLPEAKQSKHFVGGFDSTSRLYYYRLDEWEIDDSWRVQRVGVDAHVERIGDAGYYPEHLGVMDDRAVWSNRHARWRCGLNDAIPHHPYHRYREAGKDGQDLLVIRDENDGHESVLGKVDLRDDEVEFTKISELSHEAQFVRNLPNPVPSGVITHVTVSPHHGWFVVFNDDHGATLARRVTEEDVQQIDLSAVERECGGPVSIGAIASSHNRVAIQVSNFNRTNQVWVADLTKKGVGAFEALMPGLVHGVESFSIHCQVHSSPAQATDGTNIEFNYFELSSDDVQTNGRTVVYIHGGPAVRLKLEHKAEISSLIGEGFSVVAPNVPGSAGQGGWFAGLDDGVDARLALFEAAWVPFLEELYDQLGPLCLYGGSYAGYVIAKILTTDPQRFVHAAVVRNGVTDWEVFVDRTAPFRKRNRCSEYFGEPNPDPEALPGLCAALNPSGVSNVDPSKVRFVVGLSDTRVPPGCTSAFVNQAWPNAGPDEIHQMIQPIRGQGHQFQGRKVRMNLVRIAINLFATEP